jgi:hypothetical protein
MHGGSHDGQDLIPAVAGAGADARALLLDLTPTRLGAHVAEPKGKGAALHGTNRVDGTAVVKKKAPAPAIFTQTVAIFKRITKPVNKALSIHTQVFDNNVYFTFGEIDGARVAHTARTALPALKTDTLIKKIGA